LTKPTHLLRFATRSTRSERGAMAVVTKDIALRQSVRNSRDETPFAYFVPRSISLKTSTAA
jgi:hypothetical protein